MTDVVLTAGGQEFPVHRLVMAASSNYFLAMFGSREAFREQGRDRVELAGVSPAALGALVDFVYSGRIDIDDANVEDLLPAADQLQIPDVKEACCEYLGSRLHPANVLGIRHFADLHGCPDLKEASDVFVDAHFQQVIAGDEFLKLPAEAVANLISSDSAVLMAEEAVLEAVIAWVNHRQDDDVDNEDIKDKEERLAKLPELLKCVKLPLLPRHYLLGTVFQAPLMDLFEAQPRCKDLLLEALRFQLSTPEERERLLAPSSGLLPEEARARATPRGVRSARLTGQPKMILAVGGQAPRAINQVEGFDLQRGRWVQVSRMPSQRCRCGVAVIDGTVFVVGGFDGSLRVKDVEQYLPDIDAWVPFVSLNHRRSTHGVAVLGSRIYAVGGFDGNTGLSSAEVIDVPVRLKAHQKLLHLPERGLRWRAIASMATLRSSVAVGVLCGKVYAVGGFDGESHSCLSSAEVYDPDRDVWTRIPDMSARRSGASVAALEGRLYVVGGHDGPHVWKSVERYDPVSNSWSSVAETTFGRRNAALVEVGGHLYVMGGEEGEVFLDSLEVYDPVADTWTLTDSKMLSGRSYTGACVIDRPADLGSDEDAKL